MDSDGPCEDPLRDCKSARIRAQDGVAKFEEAGRKYLDEVCDFGVIPGRTVRSPSGGGVEAASSTRRRLALRSDVLKRRAENVAAEATAEAGVVSFSELV